MQSICYTLKIVLLLLSFVVPAIGAEDTRLSQPVTITFTNERLHSVIDEIAKLTGVDIRCGKDNKDWQVRDIPVIVCVKDMPLGKLLRLIADSTHLAFTVKHTDDSDKPMYRIYRDDKCMDDLYAEWDDQCKLIKWEWDALAVLGKTPNLDQIDFKEPKYYGSYGFNERRRALARLVASLPPDTIDRIINAEVITLTTKTAPQPSAITGLYKAIWGSYFNPEDVSNMVKNCEDVGATGNWVDEQKNFLKELQSPRMPDPPTADIDKAITTIKVVYANDGMPQVQISISPVIRGSRVVEWSDMLLGVSSEWGYSPKPGEIPGLLLPEKPVERCSDPKFDVKHSNLSFINAFSNEKDWDLPALKSELHLDLPKDKKLNYGDIMASIAKASGFNIVMEDFMSHHKINIYGYMPEIPSSFNETTTLKDILVELNKNVRRTLIGEWWSINPEEKVIMGWALNWRRHHLNLVPEEYITLLETKANGNGIELDDITPILNLKLGQRIEWIDSSGIFDPTTCYSYLDMKFWRLYDWLTTKEKALAKSKNGLPLYQIGMDRLYDYLNRLSRDASWTVVHYSSDDDCLKEINLNSALLYDPEFVSTLVMRVYKRQDPYEVKNRYFTDYEMEIRGEIDGEELMLFKRFGSFKFPIYSDKRKAELGIK